MRPSVADENVHSHETHFLVVSQILVNLTQFFSNFNQLPVLYGPSGSGELKIKAKKGSGMAKKFDFFTINAFMRMAMCMNSGGKSNCGLTLHLR